MQGVYCSGLQWSVYFSLCRVYIRVVGIGAVYAGCILQPAALPPADAGRWVSTAL